MNSLLLTLNLQEDTILLNQGVLDVLGHPRQVQILINEEIGSLLGGRSLLKKIRRITGWVNNEPRICNGEYLPMHQAIRFDLMSAAPTVIPS